ncbi:hypothetical protein OIU77_031296 [Salix suchowensis]|uniref:Uncharacterized protein n=1 Tax=Salix suchowensis TaxID=1278906 RepID=A0ABQ9BHB9_9ROSI|nr:hypothetical protein OIU77_031296 [Salix suchowensis]
MFVRKLVSVSIWKISCGFLFPMPGDPQMGTEQKTLEAVIQVMLKMQGHPPQRKSQKSDDGYGPELHAEQEKIILTSFLDHWKQNICIKRSAAALNLSRFSHS